MPSGRKNISQPGAVGNNMPAALKGEVQGYISQNYLGRPANAIPSSRPFPNAVPVNEWTQNNLQERRMYHAGYESQWGRKYDEYGQHTNRSYYEQN